MDNIEDVYSNDAYYPFLAYCQERNYRTMQDLLKCRFDDLTKRANITPTLLMRIKALFSAYCKRHPDLLMRRSALRPKTVEKVGASSAEVEVKLKNYFEEHGTSLIRVTDITQALSLKRNDFTKILENVPWCKSVDGTTYFYVKAE